MDRGMSVPSSDTREGEPVTARIRMYESRPEEWYDLVFTKSRMFIEGPEVNVRKALAKFKDMDRDMEHAIPQADGDSREEGV